MSDERAIGVVPRPVLAALIGAFCLHVGWQALRPAPVASAEALGMPPPYATLRVMSLGEPIVAAQLMTLYLQAFDNQPGISIPFQELDYARVIRWLETILELDPAQQYPLLMASMGMEAIKAFADSGKKPENSPGLDFFHTGVTLITDKPVDGVPSIDTKEGLARCWG